MLFSEPKIPQRRSRLSFSQFCAVSVLFSEPKIPQQSAPAAASARPRVSVLFSEPKIPQLKRKDEYRIIQFEFQCSSASRKFLNSKALDETTGAGGVSVLFSEPKIPQSANVLRVICSIIGFSALQRAENSSIPALDLYDVGSHKFQCSSASRKFLNPPPRAPASRRSRVSVLFSEPKIPQSARAPGCQARKFAFQCSSASRKFLNVYAGKLQLAR